MNHSIYSADRMTHLKIVVVALVAGILVAGFSISARNSSTDEGFTQTARRDESRQAGGDHELRLIGRTLKEFERIHAALYSPPKSPREC